MFKQTAGRAAPPRAASEETRRQVLDTALGLFRERGFEETTMRDIAGRAGLSLGAAYYYFKSKEAIVGAYYDYVQREHVTRAREAFAKERDLRGRLRAALHSKIDIMREDRRLLRALFRYGGDPTPVVVVRPRVAGAEQMRRRGSSPRRLRESGSLMMCARRRRRAAVDAAYGRSAVLLVRRFTQAPSHAAPIDAAVDPSSMSGRLVTSRVRVR